MKLWKLFIINSRHESIPKKTRKPRITKLTGKPKLFVGAGPGGPKFAGNYLPFGKVILLGADLWLRL